MDGLASNEKPHGEPVDPAMARSQKTAAARQKSGAAQGRVSYRNRLTQKERDFLEKETLK